MENSHITKCQIDWPESEMDHEDDEYDNEDDDPSIQHQAFILTKPGKDFDPSVAPRNGDEYLMHMLYERRRCPSVVIADRNNDKLKFERPDAELSPTEHWKGVQIERFIDARKKVVKMRQMESRDKCNELIIPPANDANAWYLFCRENPPLMNIMLRVNQRTLEELLEFISEWLHGKNPEIATEEVNTTTTDIDKNLPVSQLDLGHSYSWLGRWLYGVLICLQEPIEPHVHSTLRNIARTCLINRNNLNKQDTEKASPYNVFICLITKVFDQLDFEQFL